MYSDGFCVHQGEEARDLYYSGKTVKALGHPRSLYDGVS